MKKIIALILMLLTVFYSCSFLVHAEESGTRDKLSSSINIQNEIQSKDILSFSCRYQPETKTVNVKGTMNYDAFAIYGDSTLVIYAIPLGKNEIDVVEDENAIPIAEAPVSITFAFSFKLSSTVDRYSRYAIFLRSKNGEYILTTEAQYAENDAEFNLIRDKSAFKGVSGNYSSSFADANAGMMILPVYLDEIFTNEPSGYIYTIDGQQIFFNEGYIDELDAQVRSLSLFGTKVYLRFLLRSGGVIETYLNTDSIYALPNVFNGKTTLLLHSITNFFAKRYNGTSGGEISGIVLGKSWDNAPKYNAFNGVSFKDYALICGQYVAVVSNAARDVNPKLNIVLSFSGNGFYVEQGDDATSDQQLSSRVLLDALMKYFDESSYSGIKCELLVEAEETPLMITASDLEKGIDTKKTLPDDKFYVGSKNDIANYLSELSQRYESAIGNYGVLWTPDSDLFGNALCAAYCYAFYATLLDDNITCFVVDFSNTDDSEKKQDDLLHIIKNIDAKNGQAATENILAFFGKDTWSEVLGVNMLPKLYGKSLYDSMMLDDVPSKIVGEFDYFDFNAAYLAESWVPGVGCTNVKIDYSFVDSKALRADFAVKSKDFCDLIYYYEYPENISYTPYIQFDLELTDKDSAIYEIKFVFESETSSYESKTLVKGNTGSNLVLDMSKAKGFEALKAVKISLRSLNDDSDSCTLWINKITGHSKKYSNEELDAFIKKERDKQLHKNDRDDSREVWIRYATVAVIIIVSAVLGIALMLMLQKNNRSENKGKKR